MLKAEWLIGTWMFWPCLRQAERNRRASMVVRLVFNSEVENESECDTKGCY